MTATVLVVIFLATLIRSTFGFGEALVAVPLLALLMPVEVAAPVAALASVTVAALVLARDWSDVRKGAAARMVAATLFGVPFGLLLLTRVPEPLVKALLGVVIVAFSAYFLVVPLLGTRRGSESRSAVSAGMDVPPSEAPGAWLAGFLAGILGGAYGMNGPPLVLYATVRRWPPRHFRATLQGYFLPASLLVVAGYASVGLWTATVTRYYLMSLPVMLLAIVLGRAANRRMDGARFLVYVHVGLVLVGLTLLVQALPR